ncbi:hypothetical protein P2Q00_12125 [Streptomyces coacervatus]|uniref:hypothetical protein n=1 Tax=Streptomyces coacervatus TaxID=647381 RepID=UPI0023DC6195|nr:hypothetical protein [Streptomyces coacervatus]MDF2266179.1 hypothetical protein [Streptomyces coacervatus]
MQHVELLLGPAVLPGRPGQTARDALGGARNSTTRAASGGKPKVPKLKTMSSFSSGPPPRGKEMSATLS